MCHSFYISFPYRIEIKDCGICYIFPVADGGEDVGRFAYEARKSIMARIMNCSKGAFT
jgi:hypothetical protein